VLTRQHRRQIGSEIVPGFNRRLGVQKRYD
jgi:hypothetical protein